MSKSLQNVVTKTIAEISLHWKVFQGQLGNIMFKHDTNVQCNCDCLHMPTVVINACFKCITHIELHKDTPTRMLQRFPFNMCAACFLSDQMKSCVWGRNVLLILTSWNLNFQIFFLCSRVKPTNIFKATADLEISEILNSEREQGSPWQPGCGKHYQSRARPAPLLAHVMFFSCATSTVSEHKHWRRASPDKNQDHWKPCLIAGNITYICNNKNGQTSFYAG